MEATVRLWAGLGDPIVVSLIAKPTAKKRQMARSRIEVGQAGGAPLDCGPRAANFVRCAAFCRCGQHHLRFDQPLSAARCRRRANESVPITTREKYEEAARRWEAWRRCCNGLRGEAAQDRSDDAPESIVRSWAHWPW